MTETHKAAAEFGADPPADDDDGSAGTLELLPPARTPDMAAITTLREHVGAMRDAKFFAEGMCYTALIPDRFRGKPGDGAAAILYGAEIGLSPIAALRSVIVIHGQPGLEARTMKALLKAKGYRFKTYESTDEACDIEAWSPDGSESERCRFTIDDAIKAEWVPVEVKPGEYKKNSNGKLAGNMKYITEPRTMLRAKATAVVCREIAPHILLGMPYSVDELATEDWAADQGGPSEPRRPAGAGVEGMRAARERREAQRAHQEQAIDAEVVDNPAQQQPAPASGGEQAAEAARSGGWTPAERRKGLNRMHQLFGKGDLPKDAREDRLIVTSKIVGHHIASSNDLSNDEIARTNHQLDAWDRAGTLGGQITEILNQHTLAQMQAEQAAAETDSPATEQE